MELLSIWPLVVAIGCIYKAKNIPLELKYANYLLLLVAAMNLVAEVCWLRWYWSREARKYCVRATILTLIGYIVLLIDKCV